MKKKDDLLKRLPDYLKGDLSEQEKAEFERRLAASSHQDEIEELQKVWQKLDKLPDEEPGEAVTLRFITMLEAYKAGQSQARKQVRLRDIFNDWLQRWWPGQPVRQFTFSIALLFAGLVTGYLMANPGGNGDIGLLRNEVYGLRQMVATSLLQSQSPSERLRGISYSYDVNRPNDKTLQALLNTLDYDPNLNVRLAAVDAVSLFYESELIQRGTLESLKRQTSPLLQMALIELMVARAEKRSVNVLNDLNKNKALDQAIRNRAGRAIEQLR